eukprot:m.337476 g.337476  ORF g.337476 m.337476 type:complete len:350 (-) comp18144_c0_seq1:107-1156(-)
MATPRIETALTRMCGIEHPIVQGGMHYVGYAEMAAAVSNAGGLGIITGITVSVGPKGAEGLRDEIRKCRKLTSKPFGVNITLLPVGTPPDFEGVVRVIIEEGVKFVETAGRDPRPVMGPLKAAGVKIIHKCVAIRHALSAAKWGADMISMDGFDCGGHPGEDDVGNWVLIAKAGRVLRSRGIPFVVSGGCATGSQLAAALALGAEGMNMGTAFMATKEAPVHMNIKKALVDADERSTTHIFRTVNNTERVYKNSQSAKVRDIEAKHPGDFTKLYPLVRGELYRQSFQETGDTENSVWSCGQSLGLIDEVLSCEDLVKGIITEAAAIIQHRMPKVVTSSPSQSASYASKL